MQKLLTILIATLCCAIGMAQTTFTFTTADDMSQSKNGFSVTIAAGTSSNSPKMTVDYETQTPEMRLYTGNTITVAGETLSSIQMVFARSSASNKQYTGLEASEGTLVSGGEAADKNDWKVDTWTGSATSVVFSLTGTGQRRLREIVINGEPVVIDTTSAALPTAADLDPAYVYPEPTHVNVPDTQFFKNEYAFIDSNILVYCEQGSIIAATDTTVAYFNCNAGYSFTITATQPIKGLAVNGYVKEDFDATASSGNITHVTPAEDSGGKEGYPAFVITDIDSVSVTVRCVKQLRCYGLDVYFQDNPEPIAEEQADTTELTIVRAEAEDYSLSDYSSEGSYSYWVKLISENEYPQVWLDIYSAVRGDLSGTYTLYQYNVGQQNYVWFSDGETDAVTAYDVDVTIEKTDAGYRIRGVLTCWERGYEYTDEGEDLVYRFSYEGPVPFTYPEGIEQINSSSLQGGDRGRLIIRNGILYIERNGRIYNAQGTLVY